MQRRAQRRSPRVVVPRPERIRRIGHEGFGWLDARLYRHGWLKVLTPTDLAVYTLLCLVGDRQGVSWYRCDRIQEMLGIVDTELWEALRRLYDFDLIAYRPFGKHASEGFHQVLSLPPHGPPSVADTFRRSSQAGGRGSDPGGKPVGP